MKPPPSSPAAQIATPQPHAAGAGTATTHNNYADPTHTKRSEVIRLIDLHVSFGTQQVLKGIRLGLHRGQTTVIVGPSGTGKSVLLKCIVGLQKPTRGEVYFEEQRVDQLNELELVQVRRRMGFLFQMGALFDSMNIADNICFPLKQHTNMSRQEQRHRCDTVLRLVGLGGIESKMPVDLSGGQRKRVALARAVVLEPQVVLYDEPTTGLDPISSDVINELIIALRSQLSITSLVVTHDMHSADKIADRIVMIYDGAIIADGKPTTIYRSENEFVQRFIHGRANQDDLDRIREGFEPVSP